MTIEEAAHKLYAELRARHPDPFRPWFAIGVGAGILHVYYEKRKAPDVPAVYEGWPVKMIASGRMRLLAGRV